MAKSLIGIAAPEQVEPTIVADPADVMFDNKVPASLSEDLKEGDEMVDDLDPAAAAAKAAADAAAAKVLADGKALSDEIALKATSEQAKVATRKAVTDALGEDKAKWKENFDKLTDEQKKVLETALTGVDADVDMAEALGFKKGAEPVAKGAPEKYTDFKVPEGVTFDDKMLKKAHETFKKQGLSQEAAQELIDLSLENLAGIAAQGEQKAYNTFETTRDKWREEIQKDPVLGGRNVAANQAFVAKAVSTFAPGKARESLLQALEITGGGDNPALYAFMVAVGKAVSNDSYVKGDGAVAFGEEDPAQIMYGKS